MMDHQVVTIAAADWERFEALALAPARDVLALYKLADDDRLTFDCGRESLNEWSHRNAWRNQQSGAFHVSLVTDRDSGETAGFVSLSAAHIGCGYWPRPAQRNQPDPLPAILIGPRAETLGPSRPGCRCCTVLVPQLQTRFPAVS